MGKAVCGVCVYVGWWGGGEARCCRVALTKQVGWVQAFDGINHSRAGLDHTCVLAHNLHRSSSARLDARGARAAIVVIRA